MIHTKVAAIAWVILALLSPAADAQDAGDAAAQPKWQGPLPDLETLENCMRKDLGWWFGKTFRFHRGGCWADVSLDDIGRVTAFEPDDTEECKRVLAGPC